MSANSKAIRNRIKSVDSTMHMAHAMELVASSKLRKATDNMLRSRNYAEAMSELFDGLDLSECRGSVYLRAKENEERICVIVIAGDRGLAGGYNSNIYKCTAALCEGKRADIAPIGKRAVEYYTRHGYDIVGEGHISAERFGTAECADLSRYIVEKYKSGEYDALYIVYTRYESVISQVADAKRILPIECSTDKKTAAAQAVFEPDSETVLRAAMPEYVSGILYGCVCESFTCELASRRNAMSNAGDNAQEMIDKLELAYNRARQGAITQEITEIVAGSQS